MNKRISIIIDDIISQYLEIDRYNRPWIVGFSGGKDSTVLLTLVWLALQKIRDEHKLELNRKIYVVCNNTMVENPIITEYVTNVLRHILKAAKEQQLPITVKTTTPDIEDTFWYCVIGKGYPVPNNAFRFCTEKLKIKPTSSFITNQLTSDGEAIVLIGTRIDESQQRAKSIKKHDVKGQRLSSHPLNSNTFTYAPIKELMLEEVWYIINNISSPWGLDNSILFQIYSDASADDYECPTVVASDSHKSCGQSRFGCWVCTVVKEDKSMSALIKNGIDWMRPLLEFRNKLMKNRNISSNRNSTRRNGQPAVDETGHNMGNYTMEYRIQLLRDLLIIQKNTQQYRGSINLISSHELIAIQAIWYRDGNFSTTVSNIYKEVYGYDIANDELPYEERLILEESCKTTEHFNLIKELLALQKNKFLLMKKYGLQSDIENRLARFVKEES